MNKLLPYSEPPYNTYMFLANHGIIAMQNPNGYLWYINNTVPLICERKFLDGYGALELRTNPRGLRANDNIEKVDVSSQFCIEDMMKIAKAMLDSDYYIVYDTVDDYYIEGKSFFNERHFYHDGIIFGYDDFDDSFSIAAYDKSWNYGVFKTPRKGFEEALYKSWERKQYPRFVASKPLGNPEILNIAFIESELEEYISSDFEKYPIDSNNQISGIVAQDYTVIYLKMLTDGRIKYDKLDWRIMRMIWEHKKCMFDRIRMIEEKLGLSSYISESYSAIVRDSNIMRLQYVKCHFKKNDDVLLSIANKILDINKKEKNLISKLISEMKKRRNI